MNKIIKTKFIKFLPEVGILILSPSFFLKWFSCRAPDRGLDLSYTDLLKSDSSVYFYSSCLWVYLLSLTFTIYFLKKFDLVKYFVLFSLFLFFNLIFIFWSMTALGIHMTFDIPCHPEPGFLLHTLGLAVITIGSYIRLRKYA